MKGVDSEIPHMNPTHNVHRIDLFEAVKYDIRLHGHRFIILEFGLVGLGALGLAIVELLNAPNGMLLALSAVWFLGFALNCLGVVFLALQVHRTGTGTAYGDRRLHLYALQLIALLLIPFAVVVAAGVQWRRGDLHYG